VTGFHKENSYQSFILLSRFILSAVFLLSGFEKILHPQEEFIVSLKAYQLLPGSLLKPAALLIPWVEVVSGLFLLIGLYYSYAVISVGLLLILFTSAIASTLIRGISLEDCGCFKSLGFTESGPTALIRNLILLLFWLNLFLFKGKRQWTLDSRLNATEEDTP